MAGTHSSHSIHAAGATSFVWDNSIPPVLEVGSGAVVELEAADASGGQLDAGSSEADVAGLDFTRVNPVTGPVFVRNGTRAIAMTQIKEVKSVHLHTDEH